MGSVCNGHNEKQENSETVDTTNKNFSICKFLNSNKISIDLIFGNYRSHKSATLLALTTLDQIDYCSEIRDYSMNFRSTLQSLNSSKKTLSTLSTNKACVYKNVLVYALPAYKSSLREEYEKQFASMMKEVLEKHNDVTVQFHHTTENSNGIPNQLLLATLLQLASKLPRKCHLSLLSNEIKILQLIKFEAQKTEAFEIVNLMQRE